MLGGPRGFEPPTSGTTTRRSNQTELRPAWPRSFYGPRHRSRKPIAATACGTAPRPRRLALQSRRAGGQIGPRGKPVTPRIPPPNTIPTGTGDPVGAPEMAPPCPCSSVRIEQLTSNHQVAGSNPAGGALFLVVLRHIGMLQPGEGGLGVCKRVEGRHSVALG